MNDDNELFNNPVAKHWYRRFYDSLPKWAKIVLMIILCITLVWWVGLLIYKILCAFQVVGSFLFDKRNYWTFIVVLLIIGVSAILLGQFYFGLDPFGKFINSIIDLWNKLRATIGNTIGG